MLCLTAALATVARLAGSAGPVVRCEPCDPGALLLCKPLPKECAERVREPGCGCCMTCALGEGQACGVYTARCGSGLSCQQQPGESRPLQALLDGRGLCSSAASKKLSNILIQAQKQGKWGASVCAGVCGRSAGGVREECGGFGSPSSRRKEVKVASNLQPSPDLEIYASPPRPPPPPPPPL